MNRLIVVPASASITAGTETVIATISGLAFNAPSGSTSAQGILFDGSIDLATGTATTSVTFNLRRTSLTGTLVQTQIVTVQDLNATQSAMTHMFTTMSLFDLNPPNEQAAVTSGGGALPTALQTGVNGLPVTGLTYVITANPTGAAATVNGGALQATTVNTTP